MKLEGEQILLRVYLRSTDRHGWQTAAEAIVERAKKAGLAGATLLRGICGLDHRGKLLCPSAWSLVERVPVLVEIVDEARAIGSFLSTLAEVIPDGVASLERAHVLVYRHATNAEATGQPSLRVPAPIVSLSTLPPAEDFPIMKFSEEGRLLRVFIGESDVWKGEPLFRAIVHRARDLGLAGATVLRGTMGFGAASRVHTSRLLELSTDLPIVIEIVETAEKIESLLPFLDETVTEGMITIESVRVLRYGQSSPGTP
jgi:PII-like signaling protein